MRQRASNPRAKTVKILFRLCLRSAKPTAALSQGVWTPFNHHDNTGNVVCKRLNKCTCKRYVSVVMSRVIIQFTKKGFSITIYVIMSTMASQITSLIIVPWLNGKVTLL